MKPCQEQGRSPAVYARGNSVEQQHRDTAVQYTAESAPRKTAGPAVTVTLRDVHVDATGVQVSLWTGVWIGRDPFRK